MNITEYTVEKIEDPTGILSGERYEFFLTLEEDEEDELFEDGTIQLKVLFFVEESEMKVLNYDFYNSSQDKYLDFALEEDELQEVFNFCSSHYKEA
ncbi:MULTISPECIES: DUF6509 family protein [unclassified Niallia]|uniref:DUF6509 family protein n=1 Tax=unclassified Niallia TaxID=2837522 RepID=UPI001ED9F376|nr:MULTISPECIES: DUF6509 family protein [unclassified Niallia]MCM3030659.1 DUF6509 family protein [Niallia sp. MER 6]MDL0435928.1 DUF6509 family protein [Niallia sp. SS-2023]UPO86263.1 DUF6509 family protein [Niallia sp. Man26]